MDIFKALNIPPPPNPSSNRVAPFQASANPLFGKQEFTPEEKKRIEQKLREKLGPENLKTRPGGFAGSEFTYIEGWHSIELANNVFDFNGWSCNIVDITPDFIEEIKDDAKKETRFRVGVTAVVRVTLKDGAYHEDVGFGLAENRQKGVAIENAKKEAVTDARKRALRHFGNQLGNCLYDKQHLKNLKSIKPFQNLQKQSQPNMMPPLANNNNNNNNMNQPYLQQQRPLQPVHPNTMRPNVPQPIPPVQINNHSFNSSQASQQSQPQPSQQTPSTQTVPVNITYAPYDPLMLDINNNDAVHMLFDDDFQEEDMDLIRLAESQYTQSKLSQVTPVKDDTVVNGNGKHYSPSSLNDNEYENTTPPDKRQKADLGVPCS